MINVKAVPNMGIVFSAVAERVNAIAANKKPRVSSAVTLRRPTITPRIDRIQIAQVFELTIEDIFEYSQGNLE
jgi:hypothetical protein